MRFFALKNLGTRAVEPFVPWEFDKMSSVPEKCIKDKAARTAWMLNPETNYAAYSGFEGTNANQRVKSSLGGEDGNPPLFQHALVADVDFALSELEVESAIERMDIKPNWLERSLSGNWRFVWLFEKPVQFPNYDFAVFWLSKIEAIIPYKQVAGVDEPALIAPERYYTSGNRWRKIHDAPVKHTLLLGQLQAVSAKFNWSGPEMGISIPLDVVAQELRGKYPRFNEWEGDFLLDSQGPSFWIDNSTSPKSAIVRATGIQTFSGHATKPFYNWSELISHEFVRKFKIEEMGKAIEGVYYDGRSFIRQNGSGEWNWDDTGGISLFLRVSRGLSDRRSKGQNFSPIDSALIAIKETALVTSAGSFAGYPKGVMRHNGSKFLNIHNREVLSPSDEPAVWGAAGNMPFLSSFFDGFFSTAEQLPIFLAWLSRFYCAALKREPRAGHAMFLFGPPGRGKTLLSTAILAGLLGGHAEAKEWLMGDDGFNSELFDHVLWTINDGSVASTAAMMHHFSEMVKRCVANQSFRSNEKFRKAGQVQWQGRIFITGNVDPESLRQIPNMDISMKEKIMLMRVCDVRTDGFKFPDDSVVRQHLTRELPIFARFLKDYVISANLVSEEARFGVIPYHEPSLLTEANHSSTSGTFGEIVDEWQREHFTNREPQSEQWVGTALQFHKAVLQDMSLTEAMRPYNIQGVSRMLSMLAVKKVFDIEITGDEFRRIFVIKRDKRYPMKGRAAAVPQSETFGQK